MANNLIALDADGVLLDYSSAYAIAWERAFGWKPPVKNPLAYWTADQLGVEWLEGERLAHFRKQFDEHFWSTIPAMPSAVSACNDLVAEGFELICVTAMDTKFQAARLSNLIDAGFPISTVIATGKEVSTKSPKADAIHELQPLVFVDDYLPYFLGIAPGIHKALVTREAIDGPNVGVGLGSIHSQHTHLRAFADWWINKSRTF